MKSIQSSVFYVDQHFSQAFLRKGGGFWGVKNRPLGVKKTPPYPSWCLDLFLLNTLEKGAKIQNGAPGWPRISGIK